MLMKNANTGEIVKVIGVVEAKKVTPEGFTRESYEAVCAVDPRLRGNEFASYKVRNFSLSSLTPVDLDWDAVRARYPEGKWEETKRIVMIDEGYL